MNVINQLIEKLSDDIQHQIEEVIKEGIAKKGYKFENDIELMAYIKVNGKCVTKGDTETYFIDNIPFLFIQRNNASIKNNQSNRFELDSGMSYMFL